MPENVEKKHESEEQSRGEGNLLDLTNLLQLIDSNPSPDILQPLLAFMNLKQANFS